MEIFKLLILDLILIDLLITLTLLLDGRQLIFNKGQVVFIISIGETILKLFSWTLMGIKCTIKHWFYPKANFYLS